MIKTGRRAKSGLVGWWVGGLGIEVVVTTTDASSVCRFGFPLGAEFVSEGVRRLIFFFLSKLGLR